MKHFTFYQDVPLMKILTPNGLKKLRSEKKPYSVVNFILRKLVMWVMRSWETHIFFQKKGVKKVFAHTAKNTVISWCGYYVERHSFGIVLCDLPETMQKLRFSTKLPHQEIRWNYSIFCSATCKSFIEKFWTYQELTKVYSPGGTLLP